MNLEALKHKNIHIVGISGAEGSTIALWLAKIGARNVIGHDICEQEDFRASFHSFHDWLSLDEKEISFQELANIGLEIRFGEEYLAGVEKSDLIFVPQSWFRYPANLEKLQRARKKGIEFSSLMKLYFQLAKCPLVAVTGTVGKSSTAHYIYEILNNIKPGKVFATGNDRKNEQVLDKILDFSLDNILVVEVSNRQLKLDLGKSPYLGVLTSIQPNHLDDHKDFDDYIECKKSLFCYQTSVDSAVLNYDEKIIRAFAKELPSRVMFYSVNEELPKGVFCRSGNIIVRDKDKENIVGSEHDLPVLGKHNLSNVLAAIACAHIFNFSSKAIRESLPKLTALTGRIEEVAKVKSVRYINDTSSTRPASLLAALKSFAQNKIILICGGKRPIVTPGEFDEVAKTVLEQRVKAVLVIGEDGEIIAQAVREQAEKIGKNAPLIYSAKTLADAVQLASRGAKSGEVVLFSPGCESFGMFKDYRDRGKQFIDLIKGI